MFTVVKVCTKKIFFFITYQKRFFFRMQITITYSLNTTGKYYKAASHVNIRVYCFTHL